MKSLPEVSTVLAYQVQGLGVADEFGDALHSQRPDHLDHGRDQLLVYILTRQIADEAAVDLDEIQGEVLQIIKGGEADAEVVQGDPAAKRLQGVQDLHGLLHLGDDCGLRHLEGQQGRIGPRCLQFGLDDRHDLLVNQGPAGEVDGYPAWAADPLLRGQELNDPTDHPAVDVVDHPRLLGNAQELTRCNHFALGTQHPQQHFVRGRPALFQVDDRLAIQEEAIPFHRVSDLFHSSEPLAIVFYELTGFDQLPVDLAYRVNDGQQ